MGRSAPKILLVTQHYWPEPIGSAPYCTDLAEWLATAGWQVTVLTCRPHYPEGVVPPPYRDGSRDREERNSVRIRRVPPWRPGRRGAVGRILGEVLFLARGAGAIAAKRVARSGLVISLCPSMLATLVGRLACRRGGRHIVLVHDIQSGLASGLGMIAGSWLPMLMRRMERWLLNGVDEVLVLSEQMRRRLGEQGVTTPIRVLPIWVDADVIRPIDKARYGPVTALYSGNLGRKQSLDQLIRLAEILQSRSSPLRVVIRGTGSEAERLMKETERRRLDNIEFRPLVPSDRFNESLADGDVHLVPQDGSVADYAVPSKIYGIMAAGRPFVATAESGSQLWCLQRETGAFKCVPPDDPEALAEAVLTLGTDARQRADLGSRGRRFVVRCHDKATVLGALETRLKRFLNGDDERRRA